MKNSATIIGAALAALVGMVPAHLRANNPPEDITPGVVIKQDGAAGLQAELTKRVSSSTARVMKGNGLAGAVGGARVRVSSTDPQEVLLPIPQLTGGQVPVCYCVSSTPADAVTEYRLRKRENTNVVVGVRLTGKKQEV